MRIEQTDDPKILATTHQWLLDYNAAHVTNKWTPIQLIAFGEEGQIIGSLDGEVFWGKMHVDNLVVHPDYRGQGVGSGLLKRAENIASQQGCSGVYLDWLSFQALGFYLRLGYLEIGAIEGFENQTTRYYLHKAIPPSVTRNS